MDLLMRIVREFYKRIFEVKNILKSNEILLQGELEERLLDKYLVQEINFQFLMIIKITDN
jgi:hypothetical protein